MTTAIPGPRRATDQHWCATCRDCDSCQGGRARLPRHWRAVIHPSGACWAACTDCGGRGVLCPALDAQEAGR